MDEALDKQSMCAMNIFINALSMFCETFECFVALFSFEDLKHTQIQMDDQHWAVVMFINIRLGYRGVNNL